MGNDPCRSAAVKKVRKQAFKNSDFDKTWISQVFFSKLFE